ncbi:MAG: galactose mutarotase [Bacteroidaceae bacterium]|jgi:aldose 1-epimerase|nr:galactose mutarotase [Bacteroidaceae bacterium]
MKTSKKILASAIASLAILASCTEPKTTGANASGLNPDQFADTINGKATALYTLTNANGMEVCITNLGGRVVSIMVPDRDGKLQDVVLGYDNVAQYADRVNSPSDYGSSIGRYANRISKHSITIGDENYELVPNDGDNCLHGGPTGWQYQVYDAEQIDDKTLKLTMVSPDGDNGFPGEVTAITTYTLTDENILDITWEATTTKETVINQTNHCYFNLNGDPSRVGTNMELYVNADNFTPSDANYIPTGEILPVEGTPFDFRTPKVLAEVVNDTTFDQIKNATGVDHNFCLNTYKDGKGDDTEVAATLYSPETGIFLEVFTNEPGIQVYTGNFQGVGRDADILRKHGIKYPKHVSVCLESQKYPDTPHHPEWPTANLKPGEKYYSHCAYKFSVK